MKKVKLSDIMRKYNFILLLFIFFVVTSFNSWYLIWLYPTIMWQKSNMIQGIVGISVLSQLANAVFMLVENSMISGVVYFIVLLLGTSIIMLYHNKKILIK